MDLTSYIIIVSLFVILVILILWACVSYVKKTPALRAKFGLDRHHSNPVISPRPHQEWEAQGTLNPAAVTDDEGKVHLLYRSISEDGYSQIGHARSTDGFNFEERSSFPVFQPENATADEIKPAGVAEYNQNIYTSGGGWGGQEDPRAVTIEDRVYMTYVDFGGWDSVRIALTSISVADLKKGRWNWKKPTHISPAGEVNKNWVLFPEKINGKYAILHSISPTILVNYMDQIDDVYAPPKVKSKAPRGGREEYWDNWVRGAGPPPIKTERGWLLLYHAMDKNDPNKYKLGAMILDLTDPTRVLYRSPEPILAPDMPYENDGKPGVVYASGAVVKNNILMVYYGGGDKHVCVAQTPLHQLLDWLVQYGKV